MKPEELNDEAKETLKRLKPIFEDVKTIGDRIKCHTDVFDIAFYLEMQDQLSYLYNNVVEDYVTIKIALKSGMASIITLLVIDYKNNGEKVPGKEKLESEAIVELKDTMEVEALLEGYEKIVRNYLVTTRSHVSAIKGQSTEGTEPNESKA